MLAATHKDQARPQLHDHVHPICSSHAGRLSNGHSTLSDAASQSPADPPRDPRLGGDARVEEEHVVLAGLLDVAASSPEASRQEGGASRCRSERPSQGDRQGPNTEERTPIHRFMVSNPFRKRDPASSDLGLPTEPLTPQVP